MTGEQGKEKAREGKSLKSQVSGKELNQWYMEPVDYTCIKTKTWVEISAFTYYNEHMNLIKFIAC